jgi:thiol-disulfide isomerase/thioredoxin
MRPAPAPSSRCLLTAIACGLLLASGCTNTDTPDTPPADVQTAKPSPKVQAAAPAAKVTLVIKSWKDTEALIAANKGKVVIVDLWSTSCLPCMKEFPHLVALHNRFPAGKITCISVSCDYEGLEDEPPESKRDQVMDFLKETQATCTNILLSDPDTDVWEKIQLAAIPAVYVYDATGKLAKRFDNDAGDYGDEGFSYKKHILPMIEQLILGSDNNQTRSPKP